MSLAEDTSPTRTRPSYFNQSLERGLAVLRAFDHEYPTLSISEAAQRTGLSRGTTQRLLLTLENLGYVSYDGKRFELRAKVFDLGFAYLASHDTWDIVEPFMKEAVDELGESCTVGVLDWPDVVYVARVQARRVINATLTVGSRIPAHASSLGHVLLSQLDPATLDEYLQGAKLEARTPHTITDPDDLRSTLETVRRNGWAMGDQEFEEGVRSVSVPLTDRHGQVIAAIKMVAPKHRANKTELTQRFLPVLSRTAQRINEALRSAPR